MGSQREPISKVDTAWLRMEQPTNLMMITGLVFLAHEINFDDLLKLIEKRFLAFRRFRQKAVVGARNCYWELDLDFDIRSHVRRTALPGKADVVELQELVSDLASTPLDQSKPLWQFHLVENFEGGPVLITRIHHCYADGIALIQVLLSLTDTSPEAHETTPPREQWRARKAAESNIFRRLMEPAKDGIDIVTHWTMKLMEEGLQVIKEPGMAADYAHLAGEMADELAGAILLPDDPETSFKGRLGPRKRVAWATPLDLNEVKGVSRVLGCTVNDVLISTITGALRHELVSRGEDVRGLEIRATVPVNLRPLEHAKELGNHFGLVFLPLPIGEENPLARLYRVHQFMNELKSSRQAAVAFGLLAALGMGPAVIQKPMLEMMSRKASTVLTNVPGPRKPLYLAGTEVTELMFWVPQSGSIGMGISILSYNDKVYCGLMTDRRLVPEPQEVVDRFRAEFEKLLYLTLLMDAETIADESAVEAVMHEFITIRDAVDDVTPGEPVSDELATPVEQKIVRKKAVQKRIAKRQARKKTAATTAATKGAKKTAKKKSKKITGKAAKKSPAKKRATKKTA